MSFSKQNVYIGTITSAYKGYINMGTYELYRCSVSFQVSGTAVFYTTGSVDTYGYLSISNSWRSSLGKPSSPLVEDDNSGSGFNFSISYNVTAGTDYYVWVRSCNGTDTGEVYLCIIPPGSSASVVPWSWSASNGSASAAQTAAAYSAVYNKTAVTNFSYLVWNDLVDKVKEILDATNDSWYSSYATYPDTKMTAIDKTLTANKFNSLRFNIGSHYSTGITDRIAGDIVYGEYILTLASCINSWINSL